MDTFKLKRHQVAHTKAKEFSCSYYGNDFAYQDNLTKHFKKFQQK